MRDHVHFKESCRHARWLGYFDLLGTRELIKTENYIGVFCSYAQAVERVMRRTKERSEIRYTWFSDTFLIYTENDSPADFVAMDSFSRWFVYFLVMNQIPVRGAIACGDFYADREHNLYFGKALVEAYEYGEAQDWIGYLLCPSAVRRLNAVGLPADERLNYAFSKVPFKAEKKPQDATTHFPCCILGEWVKINGKNQCLDRLREMMGRVTDEKIKQKYKNTIDFVESNARLVKGLASSGSQSFVSGERSFI